MAKPIWKVPAYLPYLQPALTPRTTRAAEQQLGVTLPRAYLAILEQQNGGYVSHVLPDSPHSMIWGIGPRFPSITNDRSWDMMDDDAPGLPERRELLVPFDGDGHWHLCLDYRDRGPEAEPSVTFVDLELEREHRVADDFSVFLELLRQAVDPCSLGILGESLKQVVKRLATSLAVRFEPASALGSGYPLHRCRLDGGEPRWVWVSPNEVPRGFARPSEPGYEELATRLPGTALRYPTRPDITVIVACTEDASETVRAAIARAKLDAVDLAEAIRS